MSSGVFGVEEDDGEVGFEVSSLYSSGLQRTFCANITNTTKMGIFAF